MALFSYALSPHDTSLTREKSRPAKPSLGARFLAALMESRQRQAEREIALYLGRHGGKLTDTLEREIENRFLSGNFKP